MVKIAIILSLISLQTFASFDDAARKYLSGTEILSAIESILPSSYNVCNIDSNSSSSLGANSVISGSPILFTPNHDTILWLTNCVYKKFFISSTYLYYLDSLKNLIGEDFLLIASQNQYNYQTNWKKLKDPEKMLLIDNLMRNILGPNEVILDYAVVKNVEEEIANPIFQKSNELNMDLKKTIVFIIQNLVTREEFLLKKW